MARRALLILVACVACAATIHRALARGRAAAPHPLKPEYAGRACDASQRLGVDHPSGHPFANAG